MMKLSTPIHWQAEIIWIQFRLTWVSIKRIFPHHGERRITLTCMKISACKVRRMDSLTIIPYQFKSQWILKFYSLNLNKNLDKERIQAQPNKIMELYNQQIIKLRSYHLHLKFKTILITIELCPPTSRMQAWAETLVCKRTCVKLRSKLWILISQQLWTLQIRAKLATIKNLIMKVTFQALPRNIRQLIQTLIPLHTKSTPLLHNFSLLNLSSKFKLQRLIIKSKAWVTRSLSTSLKKRRILGRYWSVKLVENLSTIIIIAQSLLIHKTMWKLRHKVIQKRIVILIKELSLYKSLNWIQIILKLVEIRLINFLRTMAIFIILMGWRIIICNG